MGRYGPGDIVTYYFVIRNDNDGRIIKGWTDKKKLAEFYLEFHNCDKFVLKEITKPIEELEEIIKENIHDEIAICNIYVKDTNKKREDVKTITIPATRNETSFIREECNTFLSSRIDYAYLNGVIPYMKDRYQRALKDIFLLTIINRVVNTRYGIDSYTHYFELDQLMILFRSFPDDFGK